MSVVRELGIKAKAAAPGLAAAGEALKNAALFAIADALDEKAAEVIAANAEDLEAGRANGMSEAMLDRLALTQARISSIASSVREVAALPDPVGRVLGGGRRPNGLVIEKVSVPFGVIAVIYEARPNVTVDAAALCLKSGNAVILRGGKEALKSNLRLASVMRSALAKAGLEPDCIQLVPDTDRESAKELMRLDGLVDVLIPRGGAGLINSVVANATVPVIRTGVGNCHVYIDKSCDLDLAVKVVFNAKTSRVSVCNAAESLVVHREIAAKALPLIKAALDEKGVILYGDEEARAIIPCEEATEDDWGREYLDYKMSVKTVGSLDEAIEHINRYSTGHSEAIITDDYSSARRFTAMVDSAAVYVNASTRFTDGGEFGFGAEIGISTQKLHARGPVGLPELTSTKYVITGDGQIR